MFNAMNLAARCGHGCGRPIGGAKVARVGGIAARPNSNYDDHIGTAKPNNNNGYNDRDVDATARATQ